MGEEQKRVSFLLDQDIERKIWMLKAEGKTKNVTTFIRDAILEKMGNLEDDPDRNKLLDSYNALNDEGKGWLLQCAQIAAECDKTRSIVRRNAE